MKLARTTLFAALGLVAVLTVASCSSSSTTTSSSPITSSSGDTSQGAGSASNPSSAAGSASTAAAGTAMSPAAQMAKHRGGTFNMVWLSAGTSIDTAVDYDPNWFILRMTGDGLMAWKQVGGATGNDLVPDLATAAPTPTNGGKTYTFTIRPGIKYSTGAVVKASDFAYTMTREFKVPGPGVGLYSGIVGAEACIAKPA